ncbi:MAG: prenyltransferase [Syntrophales bacterium]|nr:prenyltransferase [Syntrophales bacterium]
MNIRRVASAVAKWITLSRLPFHTVGVFPFLLGSLMAYRIDGVFQGRVFLFGLLGVILVMQSTYHAGEFYDIEGDRLSRNRYQNRFAGGTGVMLQEGSSPSVPFWTSIISLACAAAIGIILQFVMHTGPYTLLLGFLGAFSGFFYSTPPLRLVKRGIGEILIGFCYGWLTVSSAFYLQTGYIDPIIHLVAVPIALTIFNVILINEYPDFYADYATGKKNLLIRLGRRNGVLLYAGATFLAWVFFFLSLNETAGMIGFYIYGLIMALSAWISFMMLLGKYEDDSSLECMCGLTIAVNLGTTTAYIFAYF